MRTAIPTCVVWSFFIILVQGVGTTRGAVEGKLSLSLVESAPHEIIVAQHADHDTSGNTSVSNDSNESIKAGGSGYYRPDGTEVPYIKRDRDLGQIFTCRAKQPVALKAITLRTGFGKNVVRPSMFGEKVSLQILAVEGEPTLHDNGTPKGKPALHGWPHEFGKADHVRDDYFTGETFTPLAVFRGGKFPSKADFGLAASAEVSPDAPKLKGRYLRFELAGEPAVTLEPGKRYAFMVLIDEPGPSRAFTLANKGLGQYADGHGLRREGDGKFPPVEANPKLPIDHAENAAALESANLPSDFAARLATPPGTNGYPDVCTYRDLVFFIEATPQ